MEELNLIINQLPEDKLTILLNYAEELLLESEETAAFPEITDQRYQGSAVASL